MLKVIESSKIRCDNCFFSLWMMGPNRPALTCKQKVNFVGRRRMVLPDWSCPNFYPSGDFKLGSEAVRRIPLTRGKFALVEPEDYYQLSKFNWHTREPTKGIFYASGIRNGKSVRMHREIMDAPDDLVVDHIDRNGLNNCRSNLRLCTPAQNNLNKFLNSYGSSKYKGVNWAKIKKKWRAEVQFDNKMYYLGYFTDEIDAAKAYDEKASQLHGEFACLNFPPEK